MLTFSNIDLHNQVTTKKENILLANVIFINKYS